MWEKVDNQRICINCGFALKWFSYLTLGMLLHELEEDGLKITRPTFLRKLRAGKLPISGIHQNTGGWRVFSRREMDEIKEVLLEEYQIL